MHLAVRVSIAVSIAVAAVATVAVVAMRGTPDAPPAAAIERPVIDSRPDPSEIRPLQPTHGCALPSVGEAIPSGRLQPTEIEAAFANKQAAAKRCWNVALDKRPKLAAEVRRVRVTVSIERTGSVSRVELDGIPADDGGLASCLTAMTREMRFRPSESGGRFRLTLAFE